MNRSIIEHPDLQRLVNKYAGSGIPATRHFPGTAGYQEVVDLKSGKMTPTTCGKIHYAKDGVHIVPTLPRYLE